MNFQGFSLKKHPQWACLQLKAPESNSRTPIHLCCIIDTSGSMNFDKKLENIKHSLYFLLDFLTSQDYLSIITFSDKASIILNQITTDYNERENIRARISIIKPDSNTNLSAGIIEARSTLNTNNNVKQGILLLTDGIANLGLTRPNDILEIVQNTINVYPGTSISTIGYGNDHNVELLQNISTEGGGSYYVVNNLEDVAVVFGDILGGLVSCIAQQVKIILPLNTEVKTRYAIHKKDTHIEIIVGDLPAGSEASFLAKLSTGSFVSSKSFNLDTKNNDQIDITIQNTDNTELQISGEAHYLRFEVLALLEKTGRLLSTYPKKEDIDKLILECNECISIITDYQSTNINSLWVILLEQLNNCKNNLENRHTININTPHIMSQHANCLGQMRGITANSPARIANTFSNVVQRHISNELYTNVIPVTPISTVSNLDSDPVDEDILPPVWSPLQTPRRRIRE
jgi:hypothetical protein